MALFLGFHAVLAFHSDLMGTVTILKRGHSVLGKSPYSLVVGLKGFDGTLPDPLARLKKDHPLDKYHTEELHSELEGLTNMPAAHLFEMAGVAITGLQL